MNLNNVNRSGETIDLTGKNEFHYIAGSRFQDCVIELAASGNNYAFASSVFESCRFVAKRKVVDFRFTDVKLQRCSFVGTYSGAMFGFQPEPEGQSEFGEIVNCDLSAAILSHCAFLGCDLKSLKLPPWPCFGIVDQRAALTACQKNKRFTVLSPLVASEPYKTQVCIVCHAPTICKEFGVELEIVREFAVNPAFGLIAGETTRS